MQPCVLKYGYFCVGFLEVFTNRNRRNKHSDSISALVYLLNLFCVLRLYDIHNQLCFTLYIFQYVYLTGIIIIIIIYYL